MEKDDDEGLEICALISLPGSLLSNGQDDDMAYNNKA